MRLRNIQGSKDVIRNSKWVVQEPEKFRGRWAEVFGTGHPLHIEVGMGKGRFLMDMAEAHPEIDYVGIEMYDSVLLRAVQKADARAAAAEGVRAVEVDGAEGRHELKNFRFIRMDARELAKVFAMGEVSKIYLNFSDPWPKDRHAKRRLTSREFLARYKEILEPETRVEFKTDNRDLFEFSLEEIQEAGWVLEASTFDLHHDEVLVKGNIMTEYEEKFSSMGNPICKLITYYK